MYIFFCRGLIHQTHLFEYINKLKGFLFFLCLYLVLLIYGFICPDLVRLNGLDSSVRILLLLGFFCRGLIHQTHLCKYINKLKGFGFSYVWI
ncbi:hypothetical protein LCGC14_0515870 [marine sediment metagenome]|uniref:Uncharacterized protein n=1 Tax=marine sediment metagenome TaxID=412755 RepID=A0A0F9RZY1_9ZZZZ